jgi:hypothetical protein
MTETITITSPFAFALLCHKRLWFRGLVLSGVRCPNPKRETIWLVRECLQSVSRMPMLKH